MEFEDGPRHRYIPFLRVFFWLSLSLTQLVPFELLRQAALHLLARWEIATTDLASQNAASQVRFYPKGWEEFFYYTFLCLIGTLVVCFSVMIDYYFRNGERKNQLTRRVLTVLGIEVGVSVVSLVLGMI